MKGLQISVRKPLLWVCFAAKWIVTGRIIFDGFLVRQGVVILRFTKGKEKMDLIIVKALSGLFRMAIVKLERNVYDHEH